MIRDGYDLRLVLFAIVGVRLFDQNLWEYSFVIAVAIVVPSTVFDQLFQLMGDAFAWLGLVGADAWEWWHQ